MNGPDGAIRGAGRCARMRTPRVLVYHFARGAELSNFPTDAQQTFIYWN